MPDLGDLIGVYGAILASFLAWRQWRRSRNPLQISLSYDYPDFQDREGGDFDPGPGYLRVRVVNRGAAPVTVERFGIGYSDDYRRTHSQILGNMRTPERVVSSGAKKLDVFDFVEGSVLEDDVLAVLYDQPARYIGAQAGPDWHVGAHWEGFPPRHIDCIWAEDVTGRRYRGTVDTTIRELGYEDWRRSTPPLLHGRVKGWWYRLCMALYMNRRLGSRGGPFLVNSLHRLHLFPKALPNMN